MTKGPSGAMAMTTADGKTMTMPAPKPDVVPVPIPFPEVVSTMTNGPSGAMVMTTADGKTMTMMPAPKPDVVPVPIPAVVSTMTNGPSEAMVMTTADGKTMMMPAPKPVVVPSTQVVGGPQQILSQTITTSGAVVQTPVVQTAKPSNSMTMVMPGMTKSITPINRYKTLMTWPGMPGTMTMGPWNGKFLALLYYLFNFHF